MDQHSVENRPLIVSNRAVIWSARPEVGAGHYLAVFNRGERAEHVALEWNEVGLAQRKAYARRDLWERKDLGSATSLDLTLAPHACVLYRLSEP